MATKRKEIIFKIVISDPKSGKAIQVDSKDERWVGKKIGDVVDGGIVGLEGYKLKITGGSGFEGAPMVEYVEGATKKYVWWEYKHGKNKGVRVKKMVRGNTISPEIVQINTVIIEYGSKDFNEIYNEFVANKPKQ